MRIARASLLGSSLAAGVAAVFACTTPDPSKIDWVDRDAEGAPQGTGDTPPADPGDPVFGNLTFQHVPPALKANDHAQTHAGPPDRRPMQGQNCVIGGCHENVLPYSFGGTVYKYIDGGADPEGGTPDASATVAKAMIRVIGPDGGEVGLAYTDADGNFWYAGGLPPPGSRAGVWREGGQPINMVATIGGKEGGCNDNASDCHGRPERRLYAP